MNPPKTAVVGAHGFAGRFLFEAYRKFHPDTIGTDWKSRGGFFHLDLAAPKIADLHLREAGVSWVAIPASIRSFEACEKQPEFTWKRNVEGTLDLARQILEQGIKIAYFSSDGVFDGKSGGYSENDPVGPVNEYGRQKVAVERELLKMTKGQCLILRVSKIIGVQKGDGTLLDHIAQSLVEGKTVLAARDQIFSSVLVNDIPKAVLALQVANAEGIFHVAGPEALSRFTIAQKMAAQLHASEKLIRPISLDDIKDGIPRPKDLSVQCERLRKFIGFPMTSMSECINQVAIQYQDSLKEI